MLQNPDVHVASACAPARYYCVPVSQVPQAPYVSVAAGMLQDKRAGRVLSPLNILFNLYCFFPTVVSSQSKKTVEDTMLGTEYLELLLIRRHCRACRSGIAAAIRNQQPMTKDSRKTLTRSAFNQTRQRAKSTGQMEPTYLMTHRHFGGSSEVLFPVCIPQGL